jgi:hypothetical protein
MGPALKPETKNAEKIEEIEWARGPQKRGARGICRFCHMVNPALVLMVLKLSQ